MCTAGAIIDAANKIDLAPWGYAPGSSILTCTDCQRTKSADDAMFIGHKHGYRCATHALEARQSAIRAQEGHLVPDPGQELADAIDATLKASRDSFIRLAFIGSTLLGTCLIAATIFVTS